MRARLEEIVVVASLEWPIWSTDGLSASILVPIKVAKSPLKNSTQKSRTHTDGSDLLGFVDLSLMSRFMQTHADFAWLGEVLTSRC